MSIKDAKVLIVDDDANLRDTLKEYLELYDLVTDEAENGAQALDMISKNKFDLVLSDVRMPVCGGLELLSSMREAKDKTPPVIMMSAFTDVTEDKLKKLGAYAFYMKPSELDTLLALITDCIEESRIDQNA